MPTTLWMTSQPLFAGNWDEQTKRLRTPPLDLMRNPPKSWSLATFVAILSQAWTLGGVRGAKYMIAEFTKIENHEAYKWAIANALASLRNPGEPSSTGWRNCPFFGSEDGAWVYFSQSQGADGRPEVVIRRFDSPFETESDHRTIGRIADCTIENMADFYWTAIYQNPEFYGSELVEIAGNPPERELTTVLIV